MGAFEYLLKPLAVRQLREIVGRAVRLSQMSHVPAMCDEAETSDAEGEHLVGRSPQMQELYKSIGRIAPQDVTVLILGESGSGKELVARAIYQHSRRNRDFLPGHQLRGNPRIAVGERTVRARTGAFTGADRRRIGKFEQADGGTIFMDEVGDMAAGPQAKLLRLLENQQFERVGGNASIHTNVRVIAATNQDLDAMAAAGRFRQDLFYRLNVLTIRIPPLRERMDDIPLLVDYFLNRANRELGRHVRDLSPEALADPQAALLAGKRARAAEHDQVRFDPCHRRPADSGLPPGRLSQAVTCRGRRGAGSRFHCGLRCRDPPPLPGGERPTCITPSRKTWTGSSWMRC